MVNASVFFGGGAAQGYSHVHRPDREATFHPVADSVFQTAYDDELIDGNPCPRKTSFTIPKKYVRHAASLHFSRLPQLMGWLQKSTI